MSRQGNEHTKNLSCNMKRGAVTKNQWLRTKMMSRHAFEVAAYNVVESKTARSRHAFEVATYISENGGRLQDKTHSL